MAGVNTKKFTYNSSDDERLDHFLRSQLPAHSRSYIQRLITEGLVAVDGVITTKTGCILNRQGLVVEIQIPEPVSSNLIPEKIPLDIIFENDNIIVVNKPAGMVVHPAAGHYSGTLMHAVLGHDPFIIGVGGEKRPGLVHRLDKNTSGVIILAKNDHSHQWLQRQFKTRKVEKQYIALVDRHPPTESGKINAPVYRDRTNRKKMAVAPKGKGKEAITIYHTLKKYKRFSLLEIDLLTGRTHQIRVHLSSIGSPITGDIVYGLSTPTLKINRHFLHAKSLGIRLPENKQFRKFTAELPIELTEVLSNLDNEEK